MKKKTVYIILQRDMLEKYCEKQGWEVVAVYQDDGFTGQVQQQLLLQLLQLLTMQSQSSAGYER